MLAIITKRDRKTYWKNGIPGYMIWGKIRWVNNVVSDGTDNTKTRKSGGTGYMPFGVVLSPNKTAGIGNVCGMEDNCADICLDGTGRGAAVGEMGEIIHGSRIARTLAWYKERQWFLDNLHAEIETARAKAHRQGMDPCFRLNMFSDLMWEKFGVPQQHKDSIFYDYTKHAHRVGQILDNYFVTFSRDGDKDDVTCQKLVREGKNVTIVFDDGVTTNTRNLHGKKPGWLKPLPTSWNGLKCINGDDHDRRWEDEPGVVVALRLKAHSAEFRLKAVNSGFAIPI